MQEKRRKYSPEFKVEAARLVVESSRPIAEVAREIGVHEGTLGSWVSKYRTEHVSRHILATIVIRVRTNLRCGGCEVVGAVRGVAHPFAGAADRSTRRSSSGDRSPG